MDKVILWDWDGTLVDSFPTIHQSLNRAMAAFGHTLWSYEQTKKHIGKYGRAVFSDIFGEDGPAAEELFYQSYAELARQSVVAKPGRGTLLEQTAAAGVKHLVISNKRGDILRQECESLGWMNYFSALVGAGDACEDKPSPVPVSVAYKMARIRQAPEHLYVGDAPVDGKLARAAKLKSLLLVDETHSLEHLAGQGDEVMSFADFVKRMEII